MTRLMDKWFTRPGSSSFFGYDRNIDIRGGGGRLMRRPSSPLAPPHPFFLAIIKDEEKSFRASYAFKLGIGIHSINSLIGGVLL